MATMTIRYEDAEEVIFEELKALTGSATKNKAIMVAVSNYKNISDTLHETKLKLLELQIQFDEIQTLIQKKADIEKKIAKLSKASV